MLKGRGKAAKPSFKPRARPPQSVHSAKPSVEPQTQTPTTSQPAEPSQIDSSISLLRSADIQTVHTPPPELTELSPQVPASENPKPRTREDEPHEAATKQVESAQEGTVVSVPQVEASSNQTPIGDHPKNTRITYNAVTTSTRKRKAADDGPFDSPSKRPSLGSEGQQQQSRNVQETTESMTQASSADEITHKPTSQSIQKAQTHEPDNDTSVSIAAPITLEHNGRDKPHSPPPECDEETEAPSYRYPSPDNATGMENNATEHASSPVSMGPAGGAPGISHSRDDIGRTAGGENVPMASLNPDGSSGALIEEVASGPEMRKGKRKGVATGRRRRVQDQEEGANGRTTVEMQLSRTRRPASSRKPRKKKDGSKKRGERAATPEGAEDEEVDPTALTMAELCKDLRIGKKLSKHDEIKRRILDKKVKALEAKMARRNAIVEGRPFVGDEAQETLTEGAEPAGAAIEAGSESPAEAAQVTVPAESPALEAATPSEEAQPAGLRGPQMRIVDGNIIVDENSLQLDRHALARANQVAMAEVHEDEFTKTFNYGTHMKREKAQSWDFESTQLFYEGLQNFGTSFEMIEELFKGTRTRRQIKLKFNKEERQNPAKITRYLVDKPIKMITAEEFEHQTGTKLLEPAAIIAEHEAEVALERAVVEARQAELLEIERKKKESILNGSAAARALLAEEASGDEGTSGRGKGRKKKAPKEKKKKTKEVVETVLPSIEDEHGFIRTF